MCSSDLFVSTSDLVVLSERLGLHLLLTPTCSMSPPAISLALLLAALGAASELPFPESISLHFHASSPRGGPVLPAGCSRPCCTGVAGADCEIPAPGTAAASETRGQTHPSARPFAFFHHLLCSGLSPPAFTSLMSMLAGLCCGLCCGQLGV